MFKVCFNRDQVENIFRTTSGERIKYCSKDVFLQTHFPMKFMVKEPKIEEVEYDEENLIQKILAPHLGNKIYLLVGDTGSGKSEFCVYLKCRAEVKAIDKTKIIPIHIEKYKLTLERIVKILLEHLDETERKKYEKIKFTKPTADQASHISRIIVNQTLLEAVPGLSRGHKMKIEHALSSSVTEAIKSYLELPAEGTEREPEVFNILEKSEFEGILSQSDIELRDFELTYRYLRQKLANKFRDFLNLPDMSELLEKISGHFENRKQQPLLLVDDIVTLGPLVYDFINFLSTLETGNWITVLGVTPGKIEMLEKPREMYENLKGMETLRDRSTEIFLTRGQESTFLNENNCVDFVRPYLRLIKDCENCSDKSVCTVVQGRELYPFNDVFLLRVFRRLSTVTPREFVLKIKELLVGTKEDKYPYQVARLLNLKVPITVASTVFEKNKQLADCASWYGKLDEEKKFVIVTKELLDLFGITEIPSEIVTIKDKELFVPVIPVPEKIMEELVIRERPEAVAVPRKENEMVVLSVQNWLQGGHDFPEKGSLRGGIYEVMKRIQEFQKLKGSSMSRGIESINWDKQHQGLPLPIAIEDVDDIPSYPHVFVTRDMLKDHAYSLTFLGRLCREGHPGSDEVLNDVMSKINVSLFAKLGNQFQEGVKADLERHLQLPAQSTLEDWILYSFALLGSVLNGSGAPSVQDLKDCLNTRFDEPKSWLSTISEKLPKTGELLIKSNIIQGLFKSFFTFRKSTINFTKVSEKLTTPNEQELEWDIIGYLKDVNGESVPEYYQVHSRTFKEIVQLVSDSADELFNYDYSRDYEETREMLTKIYGYAKDLSSSHLEEVIKEIKTLQKVSPVWLKNRVNNLIEYVQNNRSNLVDPNFLEQARITKEAPISGPLSFLSYLRSYHDLKEHKIVRFVDQMDKILEEAGEIQPITVDVQQDLKDIIEKIDFFHKEIRDVGGQD